jgi:hypothetical protein
MSTYTPIASQTLTGTASSVTFSNIPQNFTDLVLVTNADVTSAGASINIRFNLDSGSNYSYTTMYGNGSTVASTRGSNRTSSYIAGFVAPNTALEHTTITHIQNYSNTTTNKTFLSRSNRASASNSPGAEALVGLWRNTSAISTIVVAPDSGSFDTGSTFNLYGIVSGSAKASGGTVTTDGTYWYHTFTSSGIFTPSTALTADILSIGGGGAGGRGGGGGGGGGGGELDYATSQSLTSQAYSIIIGAGGSAGSPYSPTNGGATSFSNLITSLGGGCGASGSQAAGNGGSGGGGGNDIPTAGTASGSNTFAGGAGYTGGAPFNGGGGGGATAVGAAGTSGGGGNGGAGYTLSTITAYLPTLLSPMTVVSSGGGGAVQNGTGQNTQPGTGGTGAGTGGGSGSSYTGPVNATAPSSYGSGGGGSAGANAGNPSSGYQGVVVVRYAV